MVATQNEEIMRNAHADLSSPRAFAGALTSVLHSVDPKENRRPFQCVRLRLANGHIALEAVTGYVFVRQWLSAPTRGEAEALLHVTDAKRLGASLKGADAYSPVAVAIDERTVTVEIGGDRLALTGQGGPFPDIGRIIEKQVAGPTVHLNPRQLMAILKGVDKEAEYVTLTLPGAPNSPAMLVAGDFEAWVMPVIVPERQVTT